MHADVILSTSTETRIAAPNAVPPGAGAGASDGAGVSAALLCWPCSTVVLHLLLRLLPDHSILVLLRCYCIATAAVVYSIVVAVAVAVWGGGAGCLGTDVTYRCVYKHDPKEVGAGSSRSLLPKKNGWTH